MANAYSIPQNFNKYIDPINSEQVNTVLATKQGTYNYNVAKIDTYKSFIVSIFILFSLLTFILS